jgi:drug/metabolite transporter (DMT)-like permease
LVVAVGAVGGAVAAVIGRGLNREGGLSPLVITCASMGLGAAALLAAGLAVETPPHLDLGAWAIVGWLAAVNTAFAFTLWNHTLRTLTAAQSSVLNNTMVVQIAILAWAFLGERFSVAQGFGLALVGVGAAAVQLERGRRVERCPEPSTGEAKG